MSSSSWAEEAQFTATLTAIKAPSGSKIKRIAELAVEHSRHYKHIVYAVERLIRKAHSTPQTIAGLYCIDAIVRHSRHSHSSQQPDVYVTRFSQHLAELLLDVVERCGNEGKEAIRKLCKTWKARGVFDGELIDRMLDEVGEEEADEEGTEEERDRRRKEQAETDSDDEGEEKKRPEPTVRPSAIPPPARPPAATVLPPSQSASFQPLPQPSQQLNTAYYPPASTAPLLPTPQPYTAYPWQQPQQQPSYPPQPTAAKLPSYAALLGDDDDDDEDDDERVHKMRQRLEAEKLKLSQPVQPTQPLPPTVPPQPPQQPPPAQSSAGVGGQSAYEYEQKRSRFGAPKTRDEVEAAMAAHGGPADGYPEPYRPPTADFHRTPSNSFSPAVSSPPAAAAPPPSYAPLPQAPSSFFDSRPRHHSNSSPHPGMQLSTDQSDCPPGHVRVLSTVLFIGHGKLETSSHPLTDWLATLTTLCQPHGQLAAIRYVAAAGAHFATFATRGQAEAAIAAMQRQRVLDRELKLGWGKSKGIEVQRFDSEAGNGFVDAREAERARLEVWTGPERSVSELRGQTEQRTRSASSNGTGRGPPSSTPAIPGFSPPAQYQPASQAAPGGQPLPFHHPSRPPPVFEPPLSAAPSPKPGPSPSVAAFLASVLAPTSAPSAAPTYPLPQISSQQNIASPPQQTPLLPYPATTQYAPSAASAYSATTAPYVPPAASYPQNGHGTGSGAVSDPWEARKRLRWDESQPNYQQQQQQPQLHGVGSVGYGR